MLRHLGIAQFAGRGSGNVLRGHRVRGGAAAAAGGVCGCGCGHAFVFADIFAGAVELLFGMLHANQ